MSEQQLKNMQCQLLNQAASNKERRCDLPLSGEKILAYVETEQLLVPRPDSLELPKNTKNAYNLFRTKYLSEYM